MRDRRDQIISPYLLAHADNPVDWWEWQEDAFDEAVRRDVPVVLGTIIFVTVIVGVINLLVDLLCAVIDPRIDLAS